MVGLVGGGLAVAGIAIHDSDDDDKTETKPNTPDTNPDQPPINYPPVSEDTIISVEEDNSVSGQLAEATDPDEGQTLTYTLNNEPANGTAIVKQDGSYTYTPNFEYSGTDYFTYSINDGNGGIIERTANIKIRMDPNDLPIEVSSNFSELSFEYADQSESKISSVLIDDEGSIFIGGNSKSGLVHKFNENGELDKNYTVEVNPYTENEGNNLYIPNLAILEDGSLLTISEYGFGTFLSKITSEGILDSNFEKGVDEYVVGNGVIDLEYYGGWDVEWSSMITTSDNQILVGGTSRKLGEEDDFDMTLVRLNADGSADETFNQGGQIEGESLGETTIGLEGLDDKLNCLIEEADGKILAGGHFIDANGYQEMMIARFNADGTLDTSFVNGADMPGIVTLDLDWDVSINSLVEDADGNIYALGGDYNNNINNMTIVSFKADGTLNTDFNPGGDTNGDEGSLSGVIVAKNMNPIGMKLTNDNKLLVVSEETLDDPESYMSKLNLDGSLDESFNYHQNEPGINLVRPGVITFDDTVVKSFDINDDNEIIVVGYGSSNDPYDSQLNQAKIITLDENGNYSGDFVFSEDDPTLALNNHTSSEANNDYDLLDDNGSVLHFMQATENGENSYYYFDKDNNDSINASDMLTHDVIDDLLNNGLDTTNGARSIELNLNESTAEVELPTIDDLLDMYNNQQVLEQLSANNSDQLYWSATPGDSGNTSTHKALDMSNGEIYELADNQMAKAIFLINDIV